MTRPEALKALTQHIRANPLWLVPNGSGPAVLRCARCLKAAGKGVPKSSMKLNRAEIVNYSYWRKCEGCGEVYWR